MQSMMMMMISTSASQNHDDQIMSDDQDQQSMIITSSTCPISWKLYNNPFFSSTNNTPNHSTNNPLKHFQRKYSASVKHIHHHLQSDLKMSSSKNCSDYESIEARTRVAELKSELEIERKQRKKMEMLNKKLTKEIIDQGEKTKEKICVCEDLKKEISRLKDEMENMKKEMEEERKMLRMAEVLREERVQMKLADAQLFYDHQFLNYILPPTNKSTLLSNNLNFTTGTSSNSNTSSNSSSRNFGSIKNGNFQRKASPEAENPHIKQGIKGFVEFQRAIKARNGSNNSSSSCSSVGSNKQSRDLGSYSNKLECQKAQLRVFFKHKCPIPYSHHEHLVLS